MAPRSLYYQGPPLHIHAYPIPRVAQAPPLLNHLLCEDARRRRIQLEVEEVEGANTNPAITITEPYYAISTSTLGPYNRIHSLR